MIPEGLEASRQQSTEDAAQLDNEDENAPLIVEIKWLDQRAWLFVVVLPLVLF